MVYLISYADTSSDILASNLLSTAGIRVFSVVEIINCNVYRMSVYSVQGFAVKTRASETRKYLCATMKQAKECYLISSVIIERKKSQRLTIVFSTSLSHRTTYESRDCRGSFETFTTFPTCFSRRHPNHC